ncbi:DUF2846 domain-containing protein [Atopomonas sediminilitoris]|uniref:DUF2846 domain-containing protein n=1 Tax=Atopomonas sediminilitoris TaxID=2919919 RepID=UPI001F4EBD2B|nr:DUF2846 domain-containing protein [Atopomonas sediminilitoris]MCJ8168692.1 DUF2846 domain-containing protein [Atopomonas sediminilitoris]
MRRWAVICAFSVLVGCTTPGAYFTPVQGKSYAPEPAVDSERVLLVLYRPQSQWADQELEAPGLFVNNQLVAALPSNGYLALELDLAVHRVEMRRPLGGTYWTLLAEGPFDFNRIASFELNPEVGEVYYLRYDELNPPPKVSKAGAFGEGPLQLVDADLALEELPATKQIQARQRVAASDDLSREQEGFWRSVGRALDKIGI